MALLEAERALVVRQMQQLIHRVGFRRDKQLGSRVADMYALGFFEKIEQRMRHMLLHEVGILAGQITQTHHDNALHRAADVLHGQEIRARGHLEELADLLGGSADRAGHTRAFLDQSGLLDHARHTLELRQVVRDAVRLLKQVGARAVLGIQHTVAAQQSKRLAPGFPAYAEQLRHVGLGRYLRTRFEFSVVIKRHKGFFCA